jgi:hypothetical protein
MYQSVMLLCFIKPFAKNTIAKYYQECLLLAGFCPSRRAATDAKLTFEVRK